MPESKEPKQDSKDYSIVEYSDLVQRRNYGKIKRVFDFPNYADIQTNSYKKFINNDLEELIKGFFPIISTNGKYQLEFNGLKITEPQCSEQEAELRSLTYASNVYIDVQLKDNETGQIYKTKKTKSKKIKGKSDKPVPDGIFLTSLPRMTERGTFLINGTEKFIISQIVRSPGSYILHKAQLKLSNSRRRLLDGLICEVLPIKGTMFSIYIQKEESKEKHDKPKYIQIMLRDVLGNQSKLVPITQFLKALGYTENIINQIYGDEELILNSYKNEKYNEKEIFTFPEISEMISDLKKIKTKADLRKKILTPDFKIRSALFDYEEIKNKIEDLESKLVDEEAKKDDQSPTAISKLKTDIDKLRVDLQKYLDIIIVEHAACSLVEGLNISQKTLDNLAERISDQDEFCFQTIIWYHFFNTTTFNMSLAGRYKINQKMKVNERLFDQVLSRPIVDKANRTLVKADSKLFKKEVDIIIDAIKDDRVNVSNTYDPIFIPGSKAKTKSGIIVDNTVNSIYVHAPKTSSEQKELRIIGTTVKDDVINLTMSDIFAFISYVINLNYGVGQYDEVDHLGNKRLKLVGELLYGKMNVGMIRVDKFIREKLAIASSSANTQTADQNTQADPNAVANNAQPAQNNYDDIEATEFVATKKGKNINVKPIINTKPLQQIVREFFNSYQLTQFIDQQNPLSELTNKRRISAMGPGGISREDPNLGIRDINSSYYGRICPIETPEGMNIGLIMSLASYVRVDQNGFLITPYFVIENGSLVYQQNVNGVREAKIEWLDALKETEHIIANASTPMDDKGHILSDNVMCRFKAEQKQYPKDMVEYIDVNPNQVVSVAASAIPFLENDDANRALMGANMQRQATPLLYPHAPSVGTGNEYKIAYDSSFAIIADEDGIISEVDGSHIVLTSLDAKRKYEYKLMKYHRSNQNTCFNQSAIVSLNQKVKKGEVIANGPAMQNGELALGQNALVAFSSFDGYNFEDAIVISERVVNEDLFTSIHIEEKIINCLRTKNGDEEITRDIPNVSEDAKRYLDENGIVIVGADVQEGDILVGKVTPKGRVELTVEEKLLQSIFGEKVKNVRDSSLKVPYGGEGVVIAVHHFTATDGSFGDDVLEVVKILIAKKSKIQVGDKMSGRHGNKGIVSRIVKIEDMPHLADGTPIDIMLTPEGVPSRMNMGQVMELHTGISARKIGQKLIISTAFKEVPCEEKAKEIQQVLGIPYHKAFNLMNQATLYFPARFKDKKTALAKYTIDDLLIVFNHAGVSIDDLDYKVATPVFSGIKMDDLKNIMVEAGFDLKDKGKFTLYDGRTGDAFDAPISVGVMYMLKLDHLVNDKIHARNVGPYSKITQQPLGGKSQNGGQRFGEMEVWALEAYGAAYNLREILTIKSDDVAGRNEAYNAIIKGKEIQNIGLPESFKLLVKQLQGLGVKLEGITDDGKKFDLNNLSVDRNATLDENKDDKITELEDESANDNNYNYETDVTV